MFSAQAQTHVETHAHVCTYKQKAGLTPHLMLVGCFPQACPVRSAFVAGGISKCLGG